MLSGFNSSNSSCVCYTVAAKTHVTTTAVRIVPAIACTAATISRTVSMEVQTEAAVMWVEPETALALAATSSAHPFEYEC